MSNGIIQKLIIGLATILFSLPLIMYLYKFGFGLWFEHSEWAEMGAFFSGVYSPIIALLALLILISQTVAQGSINKHQYDQSYIQENRKDLDFYIEKLEAYLNTSAANGEKVSSLLIRHFSHLTIEQLDSSEAKELSNVFCTDCRLAFEIWVSIYPILKGFSANKEYPYDYQFSSSKLKVSTIISFQACIALDKLYLIRMKNCKPKELFFWDTK